MSLTIQLLPRLLCRSRARRNWNRQNQLPVADVRGPSISRPHQDLQITNKSIRFGSWTANEKSQVWDTVAGAFSGRKVMDLGLSDFVPGQVGSVVYKFKTLPPVRDWFFIISEA